jgi:hypothetical protein
MPAELGCYDYVNQPFELVRRAVVANPQQLLEHGTGGRLHIKLGGLEIGTEIDVEVVGITEVYDAFPRQAVHLALRWRHRRNPSWFPMVTATLAIYELSATETQVELSGTYAAPIGGGETVDGMAMRRIAEESVGTFVREIAAHLRKTLATNQATA